MKPWPGDDTLTIIHLVQAMQKLGDMTKMFALSMEISLTSGTHYGPIAQMSILTNQL
jgi:hypothetical protein